MNISALKTDLDQNDIRKITGSIASGRSILFAGSGFSKGAENALNEEPPTAKELSRKICSLGGFDEDEDLGYASDYFLSTRDCGELIDFVKKNIHNKENE